MSETRAAVYGHETQGPDCRRASVDPRVHVRYDRLGCGCNICRCGRFEWHFDGCGEGKLGPIDGGEEA